MATRKKKRRIRLTIKKAWKRYQRFARKRLKGREFHIGILMVCLLLVVTAFLLPADKAIKKQIGLRWHFYCFMDDIFGLKCASCALARSLAAFTRGHITKAFKYYSLGPLILIYLGYQIPYRLGCLSRWPKGPPMVTQRIHLLFSTILMVLIILDWLFLMGGQIL